MASLRSSKALRLVIACLLLMNTDALRAEEKVALPKLPDLGNNTSPEKQLISILDHQGITHNSASWRGCTVVLVFIGLECPVANSYAPEVMTQKDACKDANVLWLGVHSEPGVTKEAATKHAEEYKLTMPILLDGEQKLAGAVGAKKLGQVVVLRDLQVVYRGRIDDRFAINGKRRDEPSTHELRDVLAALAANKPVPVAETEAYGCPIPFKK
jgi:peroxiredoxin